MRISVVIPFYNLGRYVCPCLDSVRAAVHHVASGVDLEVICVDDGSTDGTAALLDAYATTFDLRILRKPNGGEGSARNAGVAAARGDWVTFLDGDDVWLPNHLEIALPLLGHHPEADIVAFRYAPFDDGTPPPAPETAPEARDFDVAREIPSEVLLNVGVFPTFFRRGSLRGLSFSALPLGADRLFVAQCLAQANHVVTCDAVVHGYRIRANSMARLAWSGRKVMSQCDYAFGSLRALTTCGKRLGREGRHYLASLWLSDVPNRLARLKGEERQIAWRHWRDSLSCKEVRLVGRDAGVRSLLLCLRSSLPLSLAVARLLRKAGVS